MKILLISGTDDLDKHKYVSFLRTHGLYFLQALVEKKIICKYFEKKPYTLFRQILNPSFLCNQFHKLIRRPFIYIMNIRIYMLIFLLLLFYRDNRTGQGRTLES